MDVATHDQIDSKVDRSRGVVSDLIVMKLQSAGHGM
jgi:hypothetical protein